MAMKHRRSGAAPAVSLVLAAAVLGACATGATPSTTADSSPSEIARSGRSAVPVETAPPEPSRAIGEVPAEIMEEILADAESRTDVPADEIVVLTAEMITWPDGSLGCPEPGMTYTQALVDGYQVVLDADGTELDYRVGEGGGFRLCEGGGRPTDS